MIGDGSCFGRDPLNEPHTGVSQKRYEPDISDHAAAAAKLLGKIIHRLETGTAPEDLGEQVVLIGRMMARKT